jgi:hypothetical protein
MFAIKKSMTMLTCLLVGSFAGNTIASQASIDITDDNQAAKVSNKLDFSQHKRVAARHIAAQYQALKPLFNNQLSYDKLSLTISDLNNAKSLDTSAMKQFESSVIQGKNFSLDTADLVEVRLADASMLSQLQNGVAPLFAFEPAGDESTWQYIEAFDSNGDTHLLDVMQMPSRPVLVVDVNGKADLKAGIALMKAIFDNHAKTGNIDGSAKAAPTTASAGAAVLETTALKKVRLNDDEEPWISGAAEIYGVVNGVSASREAPVLDVVEMPYLDHDGTDYYPNQIVIYWERYRWSAADMIIMEADDNHNYQDLALSLLNIATTIMQSIPDPTVQGYAIIPQLTGQLIKAMPAQWFTNDDDYVDVMYTLFKNQTYTDHYGAGGNIKVTLEPLNISAQ